MKNILRYLYLLFAWLLVQQGLAQQGQTNIACKNLSSEVFYTGEVFFSNGSSSNTFNATRRSNTTIGQAVIGESFNQDYNSGLGFWSNLLLAPSAPTVMATQGDLPDRIQILWEPDPLSPAASGGFNIYRDGALLTTVDSDIRSFVDFNVIAGQFYTYTISGKNPFGEGYKGSALGFLSPNGVVTGQIKSASGSPVLDAIVTLTPTLGSALSFNGSGMVFVEPFPAMPSTHFTVSCWVKSYAGNDETGILDAGSSVNQNFWIHTLPAAGNRGVQVGIGTGSSANTLEFEFPAGTENDWHHIALTYNGGSLILYGDGAFVGTVSSSFSSALEKIFMGVKSDETGNFNGRLDDVRILNRQLSQTEIQMTQNRTIGSTTDGLVAYWKFDESTGSKSFDLSPNKILSYLCGAEWTNDRPDIMSAGISNAEGVYVIENVNYGTGTTFTATPSQDFFYNQSLEFNGSNGQSADLTRFHLPDTGTVTLTVKPFVLSGEQTILSKQGAGGSAQMQVRLSGNTLKVGLGSSEFDFGTLNSAYHHLAITTLRVGSDITVKVFVDGDQAGAEETFTGVDADFNNNSRWSLGGSRSAGMDTDEQFFTGLVDEVAFFEEILPQNIIQEYANIGTAEGRPSLKHYFNLNEGRLDSLSDMGSGMSGKGVRRGSTWSTSAAISNTVPHVFLPSSKLVTLTPSNTSSDGVDFTDLSTVPVSGYVRFDGTTCFAEGVEILRNGASFAPPVYTDIDGKFTVELEPGATVRLEPLFLNHTFFPNFWEVKNVTNPIAGILFRDMTKRSIKGQLAGGRCKNSIIPEGGFAKVKVESLDLCYEKEITLSYDDAADGKFTFTNLPPIEMIIGVSQHVIDPIKQYFDLKGGQQTDLSEKSDTINFIYYSDPVVEMSPLDTNACGLPMLEQFEKYTVEVRVYQPYLEEKCYLDSAALTFYNDIADAPQFDTMMTAGKLRYRFKAGLPNIANPFVKSLQVAAFSDDLSTTNTYNAVVLGKRPRVASFTSTSPEIPLLVLHDPPGDGSYASLSQGKTLCTGIGISFQVSEQFSNSTEVDWGKDTEIVIGLGSATVLDVDVTEKETFTSTFNRSASFGNSMEVCTTVEETYQTNAGDVIVGDEADLFVGGALNLLFGVCDYLVFDSTNCSFVLDTSILVFPDKFETNFVYTEHHIRNIIIRDLETIGDFASANAWRDILAKNRAAKEMATFVENRSFDAGVVYENSVSTKVSSSLTYEFSVEISEEYANEIGFEIDGVGVSNTLGFNLTMGATTNGFFNAEASTTTTYHFEDDDILDNFTVDIKRDAVYGTPVFFLKSGQTSCPYECGCYYDSIPRTQPREEVAITPNAQAAFNIPENDAAIFTVNLGNIAQSLDNGYYTLAVVPESNPDGAVVVANGDVIFAPLTFQIPPNQSVPVVVSVLRGPAAYDYTGIKLAYYSQCEFDRSLARGLLRSQMDPKFYREVSLEVHFLEPCSDVDVTFPFQDWALIPTDGNTMFITLGNYDVNDDDLDLMRVQYRRSQGDGLWINIIEIQKDDLGALFEIVEWDTEGLSDGLYEIRAIAECVGGINPGISYVIKGKIERTPPEIFGTPQPADGVLARGDEISIQFTEPIRCDLLIQADIFNNNNVGLYDTETGDLIDAIITCQGDKIIIVPNVPNRFIENKVLRVEVDNIQDLAGNLFEHKEWEFVVDRNPVHWEGGKVKVAKQQPDLVTVTRRIVNDGGQATAFLIEGVPNWVRVYPLSGLLLPGSAEEITFEFDNQLAYGNYLDTISINPPEGKEPLIVDCRVLCESPEWDFDEAAYPQTMNFTVKLNIEGEISTDEEDIVAAFIDGQVRGTAKLRSLPSLPGNPYMAFLTVYGNEDDQDKPVKLEIWDASACLRYGEVVEQFNFEVDNVVGTVGAAQVIHTNSMVRRDIPLIAGWNWISFNLEFPDPALDLGLVSLQHPENDLIKAQASFAEYFGGNWLGSLTELNNTGMFQFRADSPDTIQMVGTLIDPDSISIPINSGWNWIGYVPNYALPVTEALAGLTPLNGDIIKGQTAFAQYLAGFGWLGSLNYLEPPKGYQLKISNAGTLTYPQNNLVGPASENRGLPNQQTNHWNVDPSTFEYSMTLVGMLQIGEQNATLEQHELGVFAGDELRGSATAIYVAPLNAYMFFLTTYSNTSGDPLHFKLFNSATQQESALVEQMFFSSNLHQGSIEAPVPFTLQSSGTTELSSLNYFEVQPNPFTNTLSIRFQCEEAQEVRMVITDATGRLVWQQKTAAVSGLNTLRWNAEPGSAGLYFVRLEGTEGTVVRKVVRQ